MSEQKFRVKYGLAVGNNTTETSMSVDGTSGDITTTGDLAVNGGDIRTTASVASLFPFNAGTVSLATAATTLSIGANTGTTTVNNSLVADDISVLTVDTTNLEVTNIKAKDGTAAIIISDSTGAVTVSSSLQVDNIDIRLNTISATDTNGSINLTPNGTGSVRANGSLDVGTIRALDGTAAMTIANSTGTVVVSSTLDVQGGTITESTGALSITTGASNGNITLTPNGTGKVVVTDNSTVLGTLLATTNLNYSFPALPLTSISGNNGVDAASSMPANSLGYGAQQQFTHYFGDTFAGPLTTAVLSLKSAYGNSVTGGTVPFTGIAQTAASALVTNTALGTINYNGYATTGFTDYIGTRNQGGGFNGVHATQIQSFALENFADGTRTISGATITSATPFSATINSVNITGTKGQISFTGTTPVTTPSIGAAVNVSGTNSGGGSIVGYTNPSTYYVIAVNSATNITLSATPGGPPIDTVAGSTTGLTFLRRGVTFGYSAQTNIPFGTNAKITIANVTGVPNGTYMALGTSTTTGVSIGIDTTTATPGGSSSLSTPSVTNCGTGFRVRAFPVATTMNSGNRLELIDHRASAATYRADTFTFNTGAYGNTGVGVTGNNINYNRVTGQWYNTNTITPAGANTAYAFPIGTSDTAITNIASVGSTSRIIPGAAGKYNIQFSVQWSNANNAEQLLYIWLRKNGSDVADSAGKITCLKSAANVTAWNWLVSSANTTDYWEIMYSVDNVAVTFPYVAAASPVPGIPSIITTIVPVGA